MNVCVSELSPVAARSAESAPPPCLIVNPTSFRASRGLARRAIVLARAQGAEVMHAHCSVSIERVVDAILARRQRQVIILAGDGTVHGIIERLAQLPRGAWLPDLLVLPGGRSNLTAADFVPRGRVLSTLKRALCAARDERWSLRVEERVVLRVEQAPGPPRFGFFVGAALIDDGIRHCHEYRSQGRGPLWTGALSTAWCLTKLAMRALRGRSGLRCPDLRLEAAGLARLSGPMRVLLVSTLLHPLGLFNPYAARGTGDVRVTAVSRSAPGFWRALPRIVLGRFSNAMRVERGYLSGRCARLEVLGLSGYSLDGERFDTDPARPVSFSPGPKLRFLRP